MSDHNRAWLRLAAAILAAEGVLTLVYSGFLPSPILPEIGLAVPILGRLTIFWSVVGAANLAAAAGVARRRRWGRALAVAMGAVGMTSSGAGLVAALTGADPTSLLSGLVGIALAAIVLYAVLRRWPMAVAPGGSTTWRSPE
jgi:hypothetical protein